jgi:hypothetical protein
MISKRNEMTTKKNTFYFIYIINIVQYLHNLSQFDDLKSQNHHHLSTKHLAFFHIKLLTLYLLILIIKVIS